MMMACAIAVVMGQKWLVTRYTSKVELKGFADILEVECEIKSGIMDVS